QPISAFQSIVAQQKISGYGREASNFAAKIPQATGGFSGTLNGQWGTYATALSGVLPTGATGKKWLFLAEGTYTGFSPTISTAAINVYNTANLDSSVVATVQLGLITENFIIVQNQQATVPNANAGPGPEVSIQNQAIGNTPITWDNLQFVS